MIFILLASLLIGMLIGIPVSFAILVTVLIGFLSIGHGDFTIVVQRLTQGGASFTLLALPLFVLAGKLMMFGSTSRLMNLANMVMGRIPGGIGCVGVAGSTLFGAVSGSGVATTAAIGSVVGPEMIKQGYSKGFTASILAGSGSLGVMIPPSIAAVVYATVANTSVGAQLFAGTGAGVMTALFLMATAIFIAVRYNIRSTRYAYTIKQRVKIILDAIPPLLMPIIIMGGIIGGVMTPTESAAVATVYAMFLSVIIYRELNIRKLVNVLLDSVTTSAIILLIIAAATPFSWLLTIENIPQTLVEGLEGFSSSPFIIMGIIIVIIIVLGIFMEGTSIIILMTPLLLPLASAVGFDPVHFGVILLAAVNIGAVTPPLAVGLYIACDIIKIRIEEVFPDVFYVLIAMVLAVIVIALWPGLSLWLPNLLM